MKYNRNETLNHFISKSFSCCVKDYNLIILAEDNSLTKKPNYFNNVDAIDLDCIEIIKGKKEKRNRNSTMDSCFVISNNLHKEMLLVEFRFNYQNLYNLNRNKLINKVNGSITILGNSLKIYNDYIFIFQTNKVQEAKNRISRMIPGLSDNYKVMDLNNLKSSFF